MITIREFADQLIAALKSGAAMGDTVEAIMEHNPELSEDDLLRACELASADVEEQARQYAREAGSLDDLAKTAQPLPGETIGDALRRKAAAGDADAAAWLAEIDSVDAKVSWALTVAAAELHPEWHVSLHGVARNDGTPGPDNAIEQLVDWLQLNHPAEAKVIEDRVRAEVSP